MAPLHHNGAELAPRPAARHAALKDEAPGLAGAEGFKDQAKTDTPDCAAREAERKHFATLRARLALAGWSLYRADDARPVYFACRHGQARELADLVAVQAFAALIGAPERGRSAT